MKIDEVKRLLVTDAYSFLYDNDHLGENIILLGLGGSHAYGTDTEESDVDIRGAALNSKEEILSSRNFDQVIDRDTDTTIYSFNKIVALLTKANPNVLELLGLRKDHYLIVSEVGRELLVNSDLFLSKQALFSFGGYATSQLRRLDNRSARNLGQEQREQHILNSIMNASVDFKNKFFEYPDDAIRLYLDDAIDEKMDKEIFMDINLTHYPLRDYKSMWSTMSNVVKDYAKIGHRNAEAVTQNKLAKHMCHLIRLNLMCIDLLEQCKVITYRENDLDLLRSIRNGDYLDDNKQPVQEFFELVDSLEKRIDYAKQYTELPEKPKHKQIEEFVISVNERVVRGAV